MTHIHPQGPVRLEHALLDVRSLDEALTFFRALLPGWDVRWDGRALGYNWVHFGPPGEDRPGYLSLWEQPDARPDGRDDGAVRIRHLGFVHPDVRGLAARLAAQGIRPTDQVDDGRFRRAYFADPNGHQLEFVEGPLAS